MLEALWAESDGQVDWVEVPDDRPYRGSDTTSFTRLEGAIFDSIPRTVFFTTTTDSKVWALNVDSNILTIIYDGESAGGPLLEPDNITVQPFGSFDRS